MGFVLRRDTRVARTAPGGAVDWAVLPKDTRLDHIDPGELDQLAPDHFVDEAGHGRVPPDWRSQERQDADVAFHLQQADEIAGYQAAKAERLAAAQSDGGR